MADWKLKLMGVVVFFVWFFFPAGIQGPTIRAEVNDQVVVHFKNFATYPLSVSPIGIPYWKQSEGEFPRLLSFLKRIRS